MPRLVPMEPGEGDMLPNFDAMRFANVMVFVECGVTLLLVFLVLLSYKFGDGVEAPHQTQRATNPCG